MKKRLSRERKPLFSKTNQTLHQNLYIITLLIIFVIYTIVYGGNLLKVIGIFTLFIWVKTDIVKVVIETGTSFIDFMICNGHKMKKRRSERATSFYLNPTKPYMKIFMKC